MSSTNGNGATAVIDDDAAATSTATATPASTTDQPMIHLERLARGVVEVTVVGTAPLITHQWSEKAKRMMLDSQQQKAKPKREPKDPAADFEAARYKFPDGSGDGVPATAFKSAIVASARLFDKSVTLVGLKSTISVEADPDSGDLALVRIAADPPTMREDMVRLESGTADIRYRPQYWPWSATLKVHYLPSQMTVETVVALVDAAGIGGIGEWRPSAKKGFSGSFGTFQVQD